MTAHMTSNSKYVDITFFFLVCFRDGISTSQTTVTLGMHQRSSSSSATQVGADQIVMHENYNSNTLQHVSNLIFPATKVNYFCSPIKLSSDTVETDRIRSKGK